MEIVFYLIVAWLTAYLMVNLYYCLKEDVTIIVEKSLKDNQKFTRRCNVARHSHYGQSRCRRK